ncbi:MAG: response regulator [Planctomycetota bacterium]
MTRPARILVVDDEPLNVELLVQLLEELGYEPVPARDGPEALALAAAALPDLVLLDVMMPGLDGFSVCRELKAHEETRLVPVVLVTALGAVDDRVRGIEAGADDFLTKPVDERELLARVRACLAQRRAISDRLEALAQQNAQLAKFVPAFVERLLALDPAGGALERRERDVSVLFLDVCGYSRLSEALPPARLAALVERYFSRFLDLVRAAGGDITETAGDGFMAVFLEGAPAEHALAAASAGLAQTRAARELAAAGDDDPPLPVRVGISSGPALVGSVRIEGASGARWTFTAAGPVTVLAARALGEAREGAVLLGPETARRVEAALQVVALGPQALKNLAEPVELFRVEE